MIVNLKFGQIVALKLIESICQLGCFLAFPGPSVAFCLDPLAAWFRVTQGRQNHERGPRSCNSQGQRIRVDQEQSDQGRIKTRVLSMSRRPERFFKKGCWKENQWPLYSA